MDVIVILERVVNLMETTENDQELFPRDHSMTGSRRGPARSVMSSPCLKIASKSIKNKIGENITHKLQSGFPVWWVFTLVYISPCYWAKGTRDRCSGKIETAWATRIPRQRPKADHRLAVLRPFDASSEEEANWELLSMTTRRHVWTCKQTNRYSVKFVCHWRIHHQRETAHPWLEERKQIPSFLGLQWNPA